MKKYLIFLFILPCLINCSGARQQHFTLMKKSPYTLRVATYNVNYGGSNWPITRPQATAAAIEHTQADIVVIQEETPFWQHYFKQQLQHYYPYQLFQDSPKIAGGLGILSRYPITTKRYIQLPYAWHPAWFFYADTPLGKIQLLNVHLNPPLVNKTSMGFLFKAIFTTPSIRLREIKDYYSLLDKNVPTIIAGDFNEGNNGKAVTYLENHGFADVIQVFHLQGSTWIWHVGFLQFNERDDHIFYSSDLEATQFAVLYEGDSDHFPVYADFRRKMGS